MPVAFLDLAPTCAPIVAAETLAAVVSLESRFEPFAIRVNSGAPLSEQPTTKVEAIAIATSLAAGRQGIQLGLGGIGIEELRKLKLSISDAFDPCLNLRATATLLDRYYRLAVKAGADPNRAEQVMLQSYYGRDDPSIGAMVKYDEQVRQERRRLAGTIKTLVLGDGGQERGLNEARLVEAIVDSDKDEAQADQTVSVPSWDVFSSRRRSSVLVFQDNQMEESE
ncbi:transglycosylase SLT domain-containing protein (plasmid) [Ensifer adhaerens]|uniref:transglycosylase SLT domain-containing protein n=1 Tax=Ensifer adhaerens TaxID=106592 RepID=UPI0023A9924E|nr:transglycosylase SLT domain-containing protein [Ensifer adhaerens]WDZ80874.1 transglycosylase SLT domain-containing protein [Ensifer adhaerens]